MNGDEINPFDWYRVLFGAAPASFLVEAFFRTAFIYLLLVIGMRLMGKRLSSQLSRNELISIVSLAAAIGIPLQDPARGLLGALIIVMVVVVIERIIAKRSQRKERFERIAQGKLAVLVKDGVLQIRAMRQTLVTRERLIAQLRSKGIKHLGQVERFYLEAGGSFTMIRLDKDAAGLCIIPDWDKVFVARQRKVAFKVCTYCGQKQETEDNCDNCRNDKWVAAVGS